MQTAETAGVDWEAIERSEEFQELVRRKRRYVVPRVIFFLTWYLGFILLAGYAEDFMNERVYEGLTVGYVLALSQFVMVWWLAAAYIRKADREFEPLEEAAVSHLHEQVDAEAARRAGGGRFAAEGLAEVPASKTEKGVRS
jgi:uncharacterized membrane protein (DUF485 family)